MASCNGCDVQWEGRSNIELLPAWTGEPLAGSLDGVELIGRTEEFRAIFAWLWTSERLSHGFRWTFQNGPGVERQVRELARREHLSRPFLSFAISTQGDLLIWETRGAEGSAEIVAQLFALAELSEDTEQTLVQLARPAALGPN